MRGGCLPTRLADRLQPSNSKPGQRVWLTSKNMPESKKLSPWFLGLFTVDSIRKPTAVKLKLPASMIIRHMFYVPQLKSVSTSELCSLARPLTLTLIIDNQPAYTVCRPVCRLQYLVDWDGYGPEKRLWIPHSGTMSWLRYCWDLLFSLVFVLL